MARPAEYPEHTEANREGIKLATNARMSACSDPCPLPCAPGSPWLMLFIRVMVPHRLGEPVVKLKGSGIQFGAALAVAAQEFNIGVHH